jgi:hypothetical protein
VDGPARDTATRCSNMEILRLAASMMDASGTNGAPWSEFLLSLTLPPPLNHH